MPAGLLYFNLIEPVITNKKVSDEKIEEEIRKNFKMNGLILADMKVVNMMDKTLETGASSIIPVQIKKDGTFGKKSNVVTKSQFEDLQKYTNKIIKEISNEILKGKINMEPVYNVSNKKTPCEYCDYKSICSFKAGTCGNKYNYIYAKPKDEILEEIHNNI
jgi:ATP-dependent helicase/nuclease subunit B